MPELFQEPRLGKVEGDVCVSKCFMNCLLLGDPTEIFQCLQNVQISGRSEVIQPMPGNEVQTEVVGQSK